MGTDTLKQCITCGEHKTMGSFCKNKAAKDGKSSECRACMKIRNDAKNHKHNPNRMYVNGKYIPKDHPLWKAGRFTMLDDTFFVKAKREEQTTTEGYVYIISNPAWPHHVKVGMAQNTDERISTFQTYSPMRDYVVNHSFYCKDYAKAEAKAHKLMSKATERAQGEWFCCTVDEAYSILQGKLA